MIPPLVALTDVCVDFGALRALDRVSLAVAPREIVAIVGESGSGKTTALRAMMGLSRITSGSVHFAGASIDRLSGANRRRVWRDMQMVFQDPSSSLAPHRRVIESVIEPLIAHGTRRDAAEARGRALLGMVGLGPVFADRRPAGLSGGQSQRVAIARALALRPRLVVADEPMSALDVSVKVQVARLFRDVRDESGTTFVIVSHDLALMTQTADRIIVMQSGRIVEDGPAIALGARPQQEYTRRLRAACLDPFEVLRNRKRLRDASP